jgi:hypothetical protein
VNYPVLAYDMPFCQDKIYGMEFALSCTKRKDNNEI